MRRAHQNVFPIQAILEESALDTDMPNWDQIDLGWDELRILPNRWRFALSQWRAIYYIYDETDRKGYVGSAYGDENLLGRWLNYARSKHGGNKLLRERDPRNFRFSILQLFRRIWMQTMSSGLKGPGRSDFTHARLSA